MILFYFWAANDSVAVESASPCQLLPSQTRIWFEPAYSHLGLVRLQSSPASNVAGTLKSIMRCASRLAGLVFLFLVSVLNTRRLDARRPKADDILSASVQSAFTGLEERPDVGPWPGRSHGKGLLFRRQVELEVVAGSVVEILVDAQIPLRSGQRRVAKR